MATCQNPANLATCQQKTTTQTIGNRRTYGEDELPGVIRDFYLQRPLDKPIGTSTGQNQQQSAELSAYDVISKEIQSISENMQSQLSEFFGKQENPYSRLTDEERKNFGTALLMLDRLSQLFLAYEDQLYEIYKSFQKGNGRCFASSYHLVLDNGNENTVHV